MTCWLAALLVFGFALNSQAKGYSSGGHSYSSHSSSSGGGSHSFSSGGGGHSSGGSSHSFSSSSGKSYSSGSSWADSGRHSYSSGKSYSSGSSSSSFGTTKHNPSSSGFNFDTGAARARKEEASKADFTRFKESHGASPAGVSLDTPGYRGNPPPIATSRRTSWYTPDRVILQSRPKRVYTVFNGYYSRPWVMYHDPYSSFFWWWLLDRSLDDRAWWAYHHRYDMDPARYDELVSRDAQLQARVAQLESQQVARDPSYTPTGLDRDLMYSDQYVSQAYGNRPTKLGRIAFWIIGVPAAVSFCAFFIWLIWFKRWQTAA
jgi:hypothetical protein